MNEEDILQVEEIHSTTENTDTSDSEIVENGLEAVPNEAITLYADNSIVVPSFPLDILLIMILFCLLILVVLGGRRL